MSDVFKRTYAVEIEFDTPITFAEQDRLACVVLEKLVDEWWENARAGTMQGNMPMKVIAYPIPTPRRRAVPAAVATPSPNTVSGPSTKRTQRR